MVKKKSKKSSRSKKTKGFSSKIEAEIKKRVKAALAKRRRRRQKNLDDFEDEVDEEVRRREGARKYQELWDRRVASGLCGRCGSRPCVCE